jgi:hypothetical protein
MEDKYTQAESVLAKLLNVEDQWKQGKFKWASDRGDSFDLLVKYGLEINYIRRWTEAPERKIQYKPNTVVQIRQYMRQSEEYGKSPLLVAEYINEHSDTETAVRYALLLAAISIINAKSSNKLS